MQAIHFYNQIAILEKTPGDKVPGTIKAGKFMNPYGRESWDGRLFPLNQAIENITAALSTRRTRALGNGAYWSGKPGVLRLRPLD